MEQTTTYKREGGKTFIVDKPARQDKRDGASVEEQPLSEQTVPKNRNKQGEQA